MELDTLLHHLLPQEISTYFDLVLIKAVDDNILQFHLDEKSIVPQSLSDKDVVSNGFGEAIHIQDFPLRNKAVYFVVRRRKWKEKITGKIYSTPWDLTANGTSYSKEFADFLKELFGQLPPK